MNTDDLKELTDGEVINEYFSVLNYVYKSFEINIIVKVAKLNRTKYTQYYFDVLLRSDKCKVVNLTTRKGVFIVGQENVSLQSDY